MAFAIVGMLGVSSVQALTVKERWAKTKEWAKKHKGALIGAGVGAAAVGAGAITLRSRAGEDSMLNRARLFASKTGKLKVFNSLYKQEIVDGEPSNYAIYTTYYSILFPGDQSLSLLARSLLAHSSMPRDLRLDLTMTAAKHSKRLKERQVPLIYDK